MKKLWIFLCVSVWLCCVLCVGGSAVAGTTDAEQTTVHVTIADESGTLALAMEPVAVSDDDGDGLLTVHDALTAAHKQYYTADTDGYEAITADAGMAITQLWGSENAAAFGCYLNDTAVKDLKGIVKDGDRITAYVYTDAETLSDSYCYFDSVSLNIKEGEEITLTLMRNDDTVEPHGTLPVAEAIITVDGEETTFVTDVDGKVTLTLSRGNHIVSAVSDAYVLVPPICKVMAAVDSTDEMTTVPTTDVTAPTTTMIYGAPRDGGPTLILVLIGVGVSLAVLVIGIVLIARKKA